MPMWPLCRALWAIRLACRTCTRASRPRRAVAVCVVRVRVATARVHSHARILSLWIVVAVIRWSTVVSTCTVTATTLNTTFFDYSGNETLLCLLLVCLRVCYRLCACSGYGFSIGGVAAFDMADPLSVVSPGGVGFDISTRSSPSPGAVLSTLVSHTFLPHKQPPRVLPLRCFRLPLHRLWRSLDSH